MNQQFFVMKVVFAVLIVMFSPKAYGNPSMSMLIRVDESAATAMEAKAQALTNGERQAFFLLMERLAPEAATEIATKVDTQHIASLVESFDVDKEKIRAGRYQAEITYHFKQERIEKLLSENKGLVPGLKEDALLILPVYYDGDQLKLWEPDNAWRNMLNGMALEEGRGKLVMPFGDPKDTFLIDHETLLAGDKDTLKKLAARYGTKNVVIATAHHVVEEATDPPLIQVSLRRAGASLEQGTVIDYAAQKASDTKDMLLIQAARDVAKRLAASTTQYSLFYDEDAQKIRARVVRTEFRHSREWMQIREHMDRLPYVDYIDLGAVSPNFAQLTLYFRGSDSLIHRALLARGLVVREMNDYWLVTLR